MTHLQQLRQAYANTRYVAQLGAEGRFTLRPDQSNPTLDAWMQAQDLEYLHVVSACNPRSQVCTAAWNQHAMDDLKQHLNELEWVNWPCLNQAIAKNWPVEESVVIGGRAQADILKLAEQLGQNAVLEHRIGKTSQLIYTALFFTDEP